MTDVEKKFFPNYCMASAAKEYLGSVRQKYMRNDNGYETGYWLQGGLDGMKSYISSMS
jgi:hypothetical protein